MPRRRFKSLSFPISTDIHCGVNRLTKQEQLVLCLVIGLLLTGWAVKAYRTAHPTLAVRQQVKD